MKLTVLWFNREKGFGFAQGPSGTYMIHYTDFESDPVAGQEIEATEKILSRPQ